MVGGVGKSIGKRAVVYALNTICALVIVFPVLYALYVSFSRPDQIFNYPLRLIPKEFYFQNYLDVLSLIPIQRFILNSAIVSAAITASVIVTGSLAAYVFAFMDFKGKNLIFMAILSTMMIPGQALIISNYLTVSSLGMIDSYGALILPYMASAFSIFFLRQAFMTLPRELHEAAKLDGCGSLRFLVGIVLPLSKPAIGSIGVYQFLQAWNMYMWPLLVTNSTAKRTVQVGMGMLRNAEALMIGPIMAGVVMILIPSILAFILGQKQLIAGLTAGSVKS